MACELSESFSFLTDVDGEDILNVIRDEHPQTIALILCYLTQAQGAIVISGMPPERQLNVIRRAASMRRVNVDVIRIIAYELKCYLDDNDFVNTDGLTSVASILNDVEFGLQQNILANLSQDDPELVQEIKQSMRLDTALKQMQAAGSITINK